MFKCSRIKIPEKIFEVVDASDLADMPWMSLGAARAAEEADSRDAMYSVKLASAFTFSPLHHQYLCVASTTKGFTLQGVMQLMDRVAGSSMLGRLLLTAIIEALPWALMFCRA